MRACKILLRGLFSKFMHQKADMSFIKEEIDQTSPSEMKTWGNLHVAAFKFGCASGVSRQ